MSLCRIGFFLLLNVSCLVHLAFADNQKTKQYMTFHASLDGKIDADIANGNNKGIVLKDISKDKIFAPGMHGQALRIGYAPGSKERFTVKYFASKNISSKTGTVMFWVKPEDWLASNKQYNIFFSARTAESSMFIYKPSGKYLYFLENYKDKKYKETIAKENIGNWKPGKWHFIACTWTSEEIKIYVDGNLKNTVPRNYCPVKKFGRMQLGSCGWKSESGLSLIDEVKIFTKAVDEKNIVSEYQKKSGSEPIKKKPFLINDEIIKASYKTGILNVKNYGAVGDGKHDDTDAIQKCLLAASAVKKNSSNVTTPEIFFPEGIYIISRTLLVPSCGNETGNFRGGKAVIKQIDPSQDILYIRKAFRHLIEGLTFEGGRRQIKYWTQNRDKSRVTIRNCVFRNSTDFAIDDRLWVDPEKLRPNYYYDIIEPYFIMNKKNGLPYLSARDETQWRTCGYNSTSLRISGCSFENCMKVMTLWTDWGLVENCKIETHPDMKGPAIVVGGSVLFENIEGTGHVSSKNKQWWITLDSRRTQYPAHGNVSLDLRNVRLKTDSSKGWCVVRNEVKFKAERPAIYMSDCTFQNTGDPKESIVHLMEFPNLITIRNCRELNGQKADMLSFGQDFNSYYFVGIDPDYTSYLFYNNESLSIRLPKYLTKYVKKPLPEDIEKKFRKESDIPPLFALRAKILKSVNLFQYGAKGDGVSDDSQAFYKALVDLKGKGFTELVIPNGNYIFSKQIDLPENIVIRGSGHVSITPGANKNHDIFSIKNTGKVIIQNLNFLNCRTAIKSFPHGNQKSLLIVDNCTFRKAKDFAIYSFSKAKSAKNQILASNCTFDYSRVLWHNLKDATIKNCWVTSDPTMADSGEIVNKGNLLIKSLIGVPKVPKKNKDNIKKFFDKRWINNYGNIYLDYCRFGSESGGIPVIVNFSDTAEIFIQNSILGIVPSAPGNPFRTTFIDCMEIPKIVALQNNRGSKVPPISIPKGSQKKLAGKLFHTSNALTFSVKIKK
jgi:Concanavalin A-like lectin/glucanases superfamily/Pectate lyase superfamily protein